MLQPHQQRVVDEKNELDAKIEKLGAFIGDIGALGPVYSDLPRDERIRLYRQYNVMRQFSAILAERIAAF